MKRVSKVFLTLQTREETAKEVAYEVLKRANPHDSVLVDQKLTEADITLDTMSKYFIELQKAVCEFWNGVDDVSFRATLKPHELRGLYLPLIYSVIFASIGNMQYGDFEYVLKANEQDGKADRDFLIQFSAKLEQYREYIKGSDGQVGNRSAVPQTSTMLTILSSVQGYRAEIGIWTGAPYDVQLSGLAALAGVSLVNEAYTIIYTGVEEVNFRELVSTIKQSE